MRILAVIALAFSVNAYGADYFNSYLQGMQAKAWKQDMQRQQMADQQAMEMQRREMQYQSDVQIARESYLGACISNCMTQEQAKAFLMVNDLEWFKEINALLEK